GNRRAGVTRIWRHACGGGCDRARAALRGLSLGRSVRRLTRRPPGVAGDAASLAKDADDWRKRVGRRARKANLPITPEQLDLHAAYLALLSAWNARMNLTALHDRDDAVDRLILEPVAAAR